MKLVLWSCTGMGNTLVVIKGKIKLVYLDINWNTFPSGKIQIVLCCRTGMGVALVLNKGQINACQFRNQLESISKQ